jgi:cobalt-zinc-cadmium efflux system membrane fusion protein
MKSIYILFVLVFVTSCHRPSESEDKRFILTSTMKKEMKLNEVRLLPVENELILNGKITFNEEKVARVFPLTGGFVKELKVELGDFVERGQPLALVRSPEIAGFTKEEIEAMAQVKVSEKKLSVAEELYKAGIISEMELYESRKEFEKASGEFSRIQDVLDMYSVSNGAVYPIKSPVSGYVIKKDITLNMELRTEDISPAFVVGSLSEVWVLADIYETDISKIRVGDKVEVKTIAYPNQVFTGRIDKVFNLLDPESKTLKARIMLPNPYLLLKPEMFASVRVVIQGGSQQMLAIPSESIVFDKNQSHVLVYHSDQNIETRVIEVDSENSKYTYIKSGLKAGERVITSHQLLIYDALND